MNQAAKTNDIILSTVSFMRQSRTNFLLQWVVRIGILWTNCHAICFAQQRPAAEFPATQKHGLQEVLSQQLFHDRQFELLLRSAESGRDRKNAELMRESLLPIFAHPHDVFELNSESGSEASLQNLALSLLTQSSPELQRSWVEAQQQIEIAATAGRPTARRNTTPTASFAGATPHVAPAAPVHRGRLSGPRRLCSEGLLSGVRVDALASGGYHANDLLRMEEWPPTPVH